MLKQQAPIEDFVNNALESAVSQGASDVHFEPFADALIVRYRKNNHLHELSRTSKTLSRAVASHIKSLANLNTNESRTPQDSRFTHLINGTPIDLRLSTLPTQFGETIVLRILSAALQNLTLDNLGLSPENLFTLKAIAKQPHGVLIVTGPTGSGKTTTLYALLNHLNSPNKKIITAEDPIEYNLPGIIQTPINPPKNITFAKSLRSFLRHDPDILMVGEIRDPETAQITLQASLTGHFLLTTLHTNDAPSSIPRLLSLDIDPFLLSSSLQAILAQRLIRTLCPHCKSSSSNSQFFEPNGCPECNHSGYLGRTGIFQLLLVDDAIRQLISQSASSEQINTLALSKNMTTFRTEALKVAAKGLTSLEEISSFI